MMTLNTEVTRLALGCDAFDAFLEQCSGMLESKESSAFPCGSATKRSPFSHLPIQQMNFLVLALGGLLKPCMLAWTQQMVG